jgi:hypothetical protein
MGVGPWDEVALESLVFHWGDAYSVTNPAPGRWVAQRRDNRETLTADSAEDLHNLILADYDAQPVARDRSREETCAPHEECADPACLCPQHLYDPPAPLPGETSASPEIN